MNVGAEPKRLVLLGVLVLLAGYFVVTNLSTGPSATPQSKAPARTAAIPRIAEVPEVGRPVPRAETRASSESSLLDFKPTLKPKRTAAQSDLASMDATLRMDLLARLEGVRLEGGTRSLFEFSTPPPPPAPKIIPKPVQPGPLPLPPPPPARAQEPERKPAAPPIALKFFGYTTAFKQGSRRAFFLDGDQILVGGEGEVLKKRYRVVRIGVNSVVMEDLEFKAQQTLPLEPQVG